MAQLIQEAKRFQKLAGILKENKTLYHRGSKGSQELIIPSDLGQDIDSDDFLTALEFAIDGEMSGMDYRVGQEYRLFVVDQNGDDPTKTVYYKFKQNGDKLEVDPSSIKVETDELNEGFWDKLKNIFGNNYKMIGKNEEYKYAYYEDNKGNKYIGMTILDMRPDPGYRTKETELFNIADEEKIIQGLKNEKEQNRQYQSTEPDYYGSLDGEHVMDKGRYLPKPIKIVNKSYF